ncbi:MAG: NUDIX domain-containing protein [Clostridia bacterium]|nr:NUDIX domain-containing protein [Clostridia bacterium]
MEFFDVYNEAGFPTGEVVSRTEAHEKGILHAAVHIYVYRVASGRLQILLQKRADDKDSFPGCWDTSCAGHVSAGETFDETLVKELSEELGIHITAGEAKHLFTKIVTKNNVFHGKPFNDHEVYRVYALNYDAPAESIAFQKEEISAVRWMDSDELLSELERGNKAYCIMLNTYREALEFLRVQW